MKKWAFLAVALLGLTSIGCTEEKPATTTPPATGTTPAADTDADGDADADAS